MTTITYDETEEDIIVIHLGRTVSDELYNEIQESIIRFLDSRWPRNKQWNLKS